MCFFNNKSTKQNESLNSHGNSGNSYQFPINSEGMTDEEWAEAGRELAEEMIRHIEDAAK